MNRIAKQYSIFKDSNADLTVGNFKKGPLSFLVKKMAVLA